jgi:hypothetical protein
VQPKEDYVTRTLAIALAASAALALGACGDDDEETNGGETGGEATALTKDAYIEQATEICARTNRELEQLQGSFQEEGLPLIEQNMADLRALPAPEGEEAQVDAMLSAGEQAVELERQAAETGREVGEDPFTEFERLAQQFGIEGGCTETGR